MFTSIFGYGPGSGAETLGVTDPDPAKVPDPCGSGSTTLEMIMRKFSNSTKRLKNTPDDVGKIQYFAAQDCEDGAEGAGGEEEVGQEEEEGGQRGHGGGHGRHRQDRRRRRQEQEAAQDRQAWRRGWRRSGGRQKV
jgi:hypothetical protein